MAHCGNVPVDFVPWQLSAFAGFGALRDLDLQLVRIDQLFGVNA
jgi:hypothetical protein